MEGNKNAIRLRGVRLSDVGFIGRQLAIFTGIFIPVTIILFPNDS